MPVNDSKPLPPLSEKDIARFWSKVDKRSPDECWPWNGSTCRGYGTFWAAGRNLRAARVAHFLHTGKDPFPLCSLHSCDNPLCCNGGHLFGGTNPENTADRHRKGRDASGDRSGARTHPERWWQRGELHKRPGASLTPEQVVEIRQLCSDGLTRNLAADQFGICVASVTMIVNGTTWSHLPMFPVAPRRFAHNTGDKNGARIHPETVRRGENHPMATLGTDDIMEIRHLYASGGIIMKELAKRFNVTKSTICNIVHRKSWKHLP